MPCHLIVKEWNNLKKRGLTDPLGLVSLRFGVYALCVLLPAEHRGSLADNFG